MIKLSFSRRSALIGLAVLAVVGVIFGYVHTRNQVPTFPQARLEIQRADGSRLPLTVEVASTPAQGAYGLMFRKFVPMGMGMLFLWDPDQEVRMWMKNTLIPLDMLFIKHDGTIVKITHAKPLDLTPLPSDEPVRGVIEIKDGEVDRNNLKIGDKVLFSAFSPQ